MKHRTTNTTVEKEEKNQQSEKREQKKKLLEKIELSTLDLIPIKNIVDDGETGFEYENNMGFCNYFKIHGFDYISATDEELLEHIYVWDKFFRTNYNDCKYIAINMPVDMVSNIAFYSRKFNKTKNPLYRSVIQRNLDEFKNKLKNRETKDFYLYIHSESYDDMVKQNAKIRAGLGISGLVSEISLEQKISVMRKYSNPYNGK